MLLSGHQGSYSQQVVRRRHFPQSDIVLAADCAFGVVTTSIGSSQYGSHEEIRWIVELGLVADVTTIATVVDTKYGITL